MAVKEYIRERFFPHMWCPGCGHGIVLNGLVRAVMVDKGDHKVVMSYLPRSFALGLAVALLAGVACLALMFRKRNQKGLSGS